MATKPLIDITFPDIGNTYTFIQGDNSLSVAGKAADAKKTGDEIADLKEALTDVSETLATKADKDGTVASAEQLLSDVGTEDRAPYLFRAVPYDSTRVDEEVVGCSVGWNQLVQNGNFESASGWYPSGLSASDGIASVTTNTDAEFSCTLSRQGTVSNITEGHRYLVWAEYKCTAENQIRVRYPFVGTAHTVPANTWVRIEQIGTHTSGDKTVGVQSNAINEATHYWRNVNCFDLTAWFGSAIADYALSLETATAGSGVAFIKALLPGGYIPYSAPTLKSVEGLSGHRFTGFNQWDEEWEVGGISTADGSDETSATSIRSKNYCPCLQDIQYRGTIPSGYLIAFFYDENKNFISSTYVTNTIKISPVNAAYFRLRTDAYGATYKHDICINLSNPARNGQYEPYKETNYALDSDLTLRGFLKMDSDHNVYADGDVYKSDGTVTHRYKTVTLDGTEEWTMHTEGKFYATVIPVNEAAQISTGGDSDTYWSNKYIFRGNGDTQSGSVGTDNRFYGQRSYGRFWIYDSAYTTVEALKAALTASPMFITYPLATPTTETALPYASPQNCEPGGTEEYVYTDEGSGIPVGHDSKYLKNMRSELERVSVAVPDAPSSNGTYTLKATVSSGTVTYAWVSD